MSNTLKTTLVLLATIMLNTTLKAQTKEDYEKLSKALDKELPVRMKSKNVPGVAIVIIDKGEVIYNKGIGVADVKLKTPIRQNTGFNIGSISKMFTAWGVMKLAKAGNIELDTPVMSYLTRWELPPSEFDSKKVTVRALLSHTAGISVHGYPGFRPEQKLPSLETSLDGVNGDVRADEPVKIILAPQTKFQYSGGGYTILQLMIEEVTGKSFANYMQEEIFSPLKMKNTSFVLDKKILKKSATPYDENGKEIYLERFTAQAAAGLHTTMEDLIKFAYASFGNNEVLNNDLLNLMQNPLTVTKGRYGLGYQRYQMGPLAVTGHAGSNDGWESGFMMDFKTKSGMIILTNASLGKDVAIATLRQWVGWKVNSSKSND